jgi:hypothetical protein
MPQKFRGRPSCAECGSLFRFRFLLYRSHGAVTLDLVPVRHGASVERFLKLGARVFADAILAFVKGPLGQRGDTHLERIENSTPLAPRPISASAAQRQGAVSVELNFVDPISRADRVDQHRLHRRHEAWAGRREYSSRKFGNIKWLMVHRPF